MEGRRSSFSPTGLARCQRGGKRATDKRGKQSEEWALALAPVVREILKSEFRGLEALANQLEALGCKTRHGGLWTQALAGRLYRKLVMMGLVPKLASGSRYRPGQIKRRGREGVNRNRAALRDNVDDFARGMAPVLASLRTHGYTTYALLADALNARNITPQRAKRWSKGSVRHLSERLREMTARSNDPDSIATALLEK